MSKRILTLALAATAGLVPPGRAAAAEPAPALVYTPADGEALDPASKANIEAFLAGLEPQFGEIAIDAANATLNVPSTHYFLAGPAARTVLEDAWGNPPDENVLGMIFPAGVTPLDAASWGATIHYQGDGYVSDADAAEINYDDLLVELQNDARASNAWRTENGYGTIEIVGWAEPPTYNAQTNKLYWAKELAFGGQDVNTLNYDIRVLGRRGALVISFIASMPQLEEIRANAPTVLDMASFNQGATYAEYQPGVDKKAAYGLAGLIGGAALAKKTGLLAALLVFGKKFGVIVVAGLAGLAGAAKRMFARK